MFTKISRTALLALGALLLLAVYGEAPNRAIQGQPVKITIDAGHGGYDSGAVSGGVSEKEVNLKIARAIERLGNEQPSLQFVLTRNGDNYVPLLDRLEFAEAHGSAAYLSIQANSFWDPEVNGVETILDRTRARGGSSWNMGRSIQQAIIDWTNARNRGVKHQKLYTRYTKVPSALVEVGFLTSPTERRRLTNPHYQERIARGIIQGLLRYFSG